MNRAVALILKGKYMRHIAKLCVGTPSFARFGDLTPRCSLAIIL
jgi:hypothetical protein